MLFGWSHHPEELTILTCGRKREHRRRSAWPPPLQRLTGEKCYITGFRTWALKVWQSYISSNAHPMWHHKFGGGEKLRRVKPVCLVVFDLHGFFGDFRKKTKKKTGHLPFCEEAQKREVFNIPPRGSTLCHQREEQRRINWVNTFQGFLGSFTAMFAPTGNTGVQHWVSMRLQRGGSSLYRVRCCTLK